MPAHPVIKYRFRERRRTAAEWVAVNEVLLEAEVGLETDTGRTKTGTGDTAWNSLNYDVSGRMPAATTFADQQTFVYNAVTGLFRPGYGSGLPAGTLSVSTYSGLPATPPAGCTCMVTLDTSRAYIWTGSAWPVEDAGIHVGASMQWRLVHKWDHAADGDASYIVVSIEGFAEVLLVVNEVAMSSSGYRMARLSFDGGTTYMTSPDYCLLETNGTLQAESKLFFHSYPSSSARSGVIHLFIPDDVSVLPFTEGGRINTTPIGFVRNAPNAPTHVRFNTTPSLLYTSGAVMVYGK